jgi:hypothetical protein
MNEIHNRYVANVQLPVEPCIRWCEEHLDNYRGWWYVSEGVFEFNNEQDYLMFMLRWA